MSIVPHIHAQIEQNVRIKVGKHLADGTLDIRIDKKFKNTATRLLTESICNYLAGGENTYHRGHGRPNYMSFGTMGILKQGNLNDDAFIFADNFEDKNPPPDARTRPWYESTSLALTTTCGDTVSNDGVNPYFWNPEYGWGTAEHPHLPVFQGELCTVPGDTAEWEAKGWEPIERLPILRADVSTDCPQDLDYGLNGYSSSVIFYGYASVEYVNRLLNPKQKRENVGNMQSPWEPVGPQLDRIGISEFGLFEKSNLDPHGLHTMLAGFRVESTDDIVYVQRNEVILVEWKVSVRALMPSEGISIISEIAPVGISVNAAVRDEHNVQLTGIVLGPAGVRQGVTWALEDGATDPNTYVSNSGLLHLGDSERAVVLYVTVTSIVDINVYSRVAIITGIIKDMITGINLTTESVSDFDVQLRATVLGRGTFLTGVTWALSGNTQPGTTIDDTGLLHIDDEETAEKLQITATSVGDESIFTLAAVVRIDKTIGSYVISDFTILT